MSLTRSLIPQQHRPILDQLLVRLSLRQGQPYEIRDGLLHIPDVPGVGLEWNEEAVAANLANL
jgi:L-alanine-DL-glutamate epimerase-like enolase superfamily enzyme